MSNVKTIYAGKVTLEKLIAYHEKEAWFGSYTGNVNRAEFHNKAKILLENIKLEVEKNGHT